MRAMLLGSCLCKGIRFQISGTHSKVIVCHCSLCRKTSGTSSASYIVTGYDQLTWLSGQDLVKSGAKHSFCRECGAHAPDANPRKTLYMVPPGILDDNPKLAVGEHIFVGSKAHWDVLGDDGALRFDEGSSGPPPPRDQIA
jgi:hypothetical protein